MSWNYRILKRTFDNDEIQFALYEVYYTKRGKIEYWTEEPVYICGENLKELVEEFKHYAAAFEKPVLDYNELERKAERKRNRLKN